MRFLIDENLPYSLIRFLQDSGHDVLDIAASPLRGSPDEKLWKLAARENASWLPRIWISPFRRFAPIRQDLSSFVARNFYGPTDYEIIF